MKIAIVQRLIPHYRIPFFKRVSKSAGIDLTVFTNDTEIPLGSSTRFGFLLRNLPAIPLRFSFGSKTVYMPFSPALLLELMYGRYDAVVAEGATNIFNNLFIYPVCRFCGSRFIIWDAGRRRDSPLTALRRLVTPLFNFLVKNADMCIAYGTVAKKFLIHSGVEQDHVIVAPNTIELPPHSENEETSKIQALRNELNLNGKKIILFVGSIEKRKKIDNLINAYQRLKAIFGDPLELLIIGDGPYLSLLKSWAQQHGYMEGVRFLGRIIDDVGLYFALCDVFVLPSEGGLSLNQAMAYSKPVIATSADGTEVDLIKNGWNGYLVEEENIPALATAVEKILKNPQLQKEMGMRSEEKIRQEFSLEIMVDRFVDSLRIESGNL